MIQDTGNNLSLTKTGSGTLTLSGANTYSGVTLVNAGTLTIQYQSSLGSSSAGTTVADGAALYLAGSGYTIAEPLSLAGELGVGVAGYIWSGAITLIGPNAVIEPVNSGVIN